MSSKTRDLLLTNVLAVVAGLAASGLLLLFLGANPLVTMGTLFGSLFRDSYTFADIFVKATPLMFTALAFGLPFQANLYNIGAQGQFYIGSITAVGLSLLLQGRMPGLLALAIVALVSFLMGGLWGGMIGWLKAKFNANEFLVSMMSTYVALNLMNYLLRTFLMESKAEYPQTNPLAQAIWLPIVVPGTRLHVGFILGVLACVGVWVLLYKTALGFRIRAVGSNKDAAELAGINYKRLYVVTFFLAGALAALGGFTEVNGVQHMLVQGFNPGVGAAGIGIAILANGNPLGMIFAAILKQHQIVTGTAINILALGICAFFQRVIFGVPVTPLIVQPLQPIALPLLSEIPVIGPILFNQNILTYALFLLVPLANFVLFKASLGLSIRSIGENPEAGDVAGIRVDRLRFLTILFAGVMCGIGGAFYSIGYLGMFTTTIIGGRGWIAFAICFLGNWKPLGVLAGTLVFGFAEAFAILMQSRGASLFPNELFIALP